MIMKAKKAKFTIEFLDGEYEGYFFDSPGDRWNGHPCPFFTHRVRKEILRQMSCFTIETIDTEDGELSLWPIGHQKMRWEVVDD